MRRENRARHACAFGINWEFSAFCFHPLLTLLVETSWGGINYSSNESYFKSVKTEILKLNISSIIKIYLHALQWPCTKSRQEAAEIWRPPDEFSSSLLLLALENSLNALENINVWNWLFYLSGLITWIIHNHSLMGSRLSGALGSRNVQVLNLFQGFMTDELRSASKFKLKKQ